MNHISLTHSRFTILLIACAAFLLLSACQPAAVSTSLPTGQPAATTLPAQPPTDTPSPTEGVEVQASATPSQDSQPPAGAPANLTLDLSGVAEDQTVETVEAAPDNEDRPWQEPAPQYQRVTLQGYPVTNHLMKPQIFIYSVSDMAGYSEAASQTVAGLQALLESQQPAEHMPYLPFYNAGQVMHAHVQYLEFQNGKGVRFLTQFDQAPLPINSYELIYTFQGLTSDGKYYIAAVLPVTHPELPTTDKVSEDQVAEMNDFPAYLLKTVDWLEQQPDGSFTPDLGMLDALIQSIEVK